jgi:hypothetical protein
LTAGEAVSAAVEKKTLGWRNVPWAAALAACLAGVAIWHSNSRPPAREMPAAPLAVETKVETAAPDKSAAAVARAKAKRRVRDMRSPVIPPAAAPPVDEIANAAEDAAPTKGPIESFRAVAPQPALPAQTIGLGKLRAAPMKAFLGASQQLSLWSIAVSGGRLQKSSDGGKTWATIPVAGQASFLALAVSGPDVWAGGEGGLLVHSVDDGLEWKHVAVTDGEKRLQESITGIEAHGLEVRLRTKSANWVSLDEGVSWRKMGE